MAQDTKSPALWGGRFTEGLHPRIDAFNRSFAFDRRLLAQDATASAAWAEALGATGDLSADDVRGLTSSLRKIAEAARSQGADYWSGIDAASHEDVHSYLETTLGKEVGDAAKRLHRGRSRNDQVATAFRLWCRESIDDLRREILGFQKTLVLWAEKHPQAVLPGYTHLQRGQPVLLAHWALAYVEMLARDDERLGDLRRRVNRLPLGSGALAGSSRPVDREKIAQALGFDGITPNSLDAVSDRDFAMELMAALSIGMVHLSRLSEDVILFSSQEFAFVTLSDRASTGSSLMPQKKNPDPFELIRGKTGRVCGGLSGLLMTMKGLPLGYNKDTQEDKEAVFDAVHTFRESLAVASLSIEGLKVNETRMRQEAERGYQNATEVADYLATKGVPFRQGHELSGKLVLKAVALGKELHEMTLAEIHEIAPQADKDIFKALSLESTLASKDVPGGTAPARVKAALSAAKQKLGI